MATKKSRKLGTGIQQLEEKAMMAGDVAVSVSGGDLIINEAAGHQGEDQAVEVRQLEDGKMQVSGKNGTMIQVPMYIFQNGQIVQTNMRVGSWTYSGVNDDIRVDLGEGSDRFETAASTTLEVDSLSVDMGHGNERDTVSLRNVATRGSVSVTTGAGNDFVSVHNSTVGDGRWEDLTIRTGDGIDTVNLFQTTVRDNVNIDTADSQTLNEVDRVTMQQVTMDDLFADLGAGDDDLNIYYSNMDDANIQGGRGNDDVLFYGSTADDVDFNGGSGVDRFFAFYTGGQDSNDIDDLDLFSATYTPYGQV